MNKPKFTSLAARLSFWVILFGVLVFAGVLTINQLLSRALLDEYVERLSRKTTTSTVREIETRFDAVAMSAETLATVVTETHLNQKEVHNAIRATLAANQDIFGMTVAIAPGMIEGFPDEFSPYYYRGDNGSDHFLYSDLANSSYQYRSKDWYTIPEQKNASIWSEPYFDTSGGNILMTTYSTPLHALPNGKPAGVTTADISLRWVQNVVESIKVGDTGFGLIVSNQDIIVAHPDSTRNMRPLKSTFSEEFINNHWNKYADSKEEGKVFYFSAPCQHTIGKCQVAVESLSNTGWKVIIVIPESELISDVQALGAKVAVAALLGLFILVIVIVSVARRITRPLGQLAKVAREIGAGNLETDIPLPISNDEICLLSREFDHMRNSLKQHIEDLKITTAREQKRESEIQIAKDIQMSMLPDNGATYLDTVTYQIFGTLIPARTVGGDLYYYQQVARNKLCFLIGDVADKGVPAALFMAKAITLYTSLINDQITPAQTFAQMNDSLSQNNDACMFVTAICGVIDLDNGKAVCANAGHTLPIIKNRQRTREIDLGGGPPLGLMDDSVYADAELNFDSGDLIIQYTDGISEALNSSNEQYSEERLLEFVEQLDDIDAGQVGQAIMSDVTAFADTPEQSDDITLLIIRYGQ